MNGFQLNSDFYENIRSSSNWIEFHNNIIINNMTNDSSDSELESLDSDEDNNINDNNINTNNINTNNINTNNINVEQTINDVMNLINTNHIRRPINTNNPQIILDILNQIQNMNNSNNDTTGHHRNVSLEENTNTNSDRLASIIENSFEEYMDNDNNTIDPTEYQNVINQLKTSLTAKKSNCPICMESLNKKTKIYNLDCKHEFHMECLGEWLKHNISCPVCREKL